MPNPTCTKCGQDLVDPTDLIIVYWLHAYHRLCADQVNRDREQIKTTNVD